MSGLRAARTQPGDPSFAASTIHVDDLFHVADVRCVADPPATSPEEVASTLEVVFPISGVFVRHLVRRAGGLSVLGDPAAALVFRPGEPYRVTHPAGGSDRCVVIALRRAATESSGYPATSLPDSVRTAAAADLLLRRWLRGARDGTLDGLAAAEVSVALLDAVLGAPAIRHTSPARDRLADAVRIELAADPGARLTLSGLGHRIGASPFHLARRFRAATGTTIHAWQTTLRVREALARIDAGERDLTRLALDLGFADHSHLSNTLRAVTGRAPSAFRQAVTSAEIASLRTILQA